MLYHGETPLQMHAQRIGMHMIVCVEIRDMFTPPGCDFVSPAKTGRASSIRDRL